MKSTDELIEELPEIGIVGINHKSAPVEIRESFSCKEDAFADFYESLFREGIIEEAVYVATCNRVEVYYASKDAQKAEEMIFKCFEKQSGLCAANFTAHFYKHRGYEAARHLLLVGASLDSMVVGENEILGQLKDAFTVAVELKKTGPFLNKLFHQAFKTAKQVRTETEISRNPLSVAFIASELACKFFSDLSKRSALLIGAGEMGELMLKYLTKNQIGEITIANRSMHNAERISEEYNLNARLVLLDDIEETAREVDIIITSVSAPHYMITKEMAGHIMNERCGDPLFMIDIAVPRNIDPAVADVEGIRLYNIDDLKAIADENLSSRMREVEVAQLVVDANIKDFQNWYTELGVTPAIMNIQSKFDEIRKLELERYKRRRLKHLSDEDFAVVEDLTRQIMSKTLHNPIMNLKRHHQESRGDHPHRERIRRKTKFVEELFIK